MVGPTNFHPRFLSAFESAIDAADVEAVPECLEDVAVFALDADGLKVMLIQRDLEPFAGGWALPGGFVRVDETLDDAARRELEEETSLRGIFLEQLYTFGDVDRDPRERVVTVAYYALVNLEGHDVQASTDARNAAWFAVSDLPGLAFDHESIVDAALELGAASGTMKLADGDEAFEISPTTLRLRTEGIGSGARLTGSGSARLAGRDAGELACDLETGGLTARAIADGLMSLLDGNLVLAIFGADRRADERRNAGLQAIAERLLKEHGDR